jgi:16S rRNA (uracil1498-N3)-methyltransferase
MHRFYAPPDQSRQSLFNLPEREAHHALNVLRVRVGERVVVLDGAGQELLCEVREATRRDVAVQVLQRTSIPPLPYQLTLVQALPKSKAMDLIVQKATELGLAHLMPIIAERSVSQPEEENAAGKVEKWQAAVIEAAKQCGLAWLPKVHMPVTPQALLQRGDKFDLTLIASLQGEARHPREHIETFASDRGRLPRSIAIWIGPEGDFTPAEINLARGAGALPITLGQLILRSETAAIYGLSVLNYEMQAPRPESR